MVRTWSFQRRKGAGSIPGRRTKIPHATWLGQYINKMKKRIKEMWFHRSKHVLPPSGLPAGVLRDVALGDDVDQPSHKDAQFRELQPEWVQMSSKRWVIVGLPPGHRCTSLGSSPGKVRNGSHL